MAVLTAIAHFLDRLTALVTGWAMGLVLVIAGIQFMVVLYRYLFDLPLIFAQESVLYFFAYFVVFAVVRTTLNDQHVRVPNLFPAALRRHSRAFAAAGYLLLLLPFSTALFLYALPIAEQSWSILERSRESAGVHLVFVLKSAPVLLAALLVLQSLARASAALTLDQSTKPDED